MTTSSASAPIRSETLHLLGEVHPGRLHNRMQPGPQTMPSSSPLVDVFLRSCSLNLFLLATQIAEPLRTSLALKRIPKVIGVQLDV